MCGGFQQGEQARAGSNRPMRALPSLYPAGEGLIVDTVELGELRPAQAAGVVGREQGGALLGGEAEPAAAVRFENNVVRLVIAPQTMTAMHRPATNIIRCSGPRLRTMRKPTITATGKPDHNSDNHPKSPDLKSAKPYDIKSARNT
jgi:hypothetical protein